MKKHARVAIALISLSLGACSLTRPLTDSTRFYVISLPDAALPVVAPGTRAKIAIRKVEVPNYLKSRSIIVRRGQNEIQYVDTARWAEPLDLAFMRLLKEGLNTQHDVGQVMSPPYSVDAARDFDVVVHIINCEGTAGSRSGSGVSFRASVEIFKPGSNGAFIRQFDFSSPAMPWNGNDYSELSARIGEALVQLCERISAELPKGG